MCVKANKNYTPCGDRIEPVYGFKVDKDGKKVFGKIGDTNTYEKIQASVTGSTLYEMIDKYQRTGDDSFLRAKARGIYADVTQLPKSMFEVERAKTIAVDEFKKFPADFRAMFNHNVEDYFSSIMNDTIKSKYDDYFKKKGVNVKEIKLEDNLNAEQTTK
jgi:hypothetical protein